MNHVTQQTIAIQELGWRFADGCWQRSDQPSFGCVSQVVYYEWQQALARAGRADHEVARLRHGFTVLAVVPIMTVIAAAIAGCVIAFR